MKVALSGVMAWFKLASLQCFTMKVMVVAGCYGLTNLLWVTGAVYNSKAISRQNKRRICATVNQKQLKNLNYCWKNASTPQKHVFYDCYRPRRCPKTCLYVEDVPFCWAGGAAPDHAPAMCAVRDLACKTHGRTLALAGDGWDNASDMENISNNQGVVI